MAIQKTEAIVLRVTKLRETSIIATFFTRDFGKLQGMVKGVRQPGSPWAGLYEPMNRLEIIFYEKFRSEVHLVTEATGMDFRPELHKRFQIYSFGYYLTEVLEKFANPGEAALDYWDLIERAYRHLPENPRFVSLLFQLKILKSSGFLSDLEHIPSEISGFIKRLNPDMLKNIQYLLKEDWEKAFRLHISPQELNEAEERIASLLMYKLDRKLKTREFLDQLTPTA